MRLLLTTLNAKYIHTNLAIRLLYQLNKGHEGLAWREFSIRENPEKIAEACMGFGTVAFSCYIWNIKQTLAVARLIKALSPHTQILLGGPEVSYEYEEVIANEAVDFLIVGEGEIPFQSFLTNFPEVEKVPGLVWKKDGRIIENPAAPMLDMLSLGNIMPYADDEPESLKNRVLYLETSRGCPYKCGFCLASLDNKMRYVPLNAIKETLLFMMQNGRVIKFLDRTFNIKKNFTLEIFEFILANHRPGNVFQFEITADILHPDIIDFIQEKVPKNLFRFEIGIQTVNQQANLAVMRRQSFEKTKAIIKSVENKVELHLDLIVGMALDEWADIKYSIEEVFKLYAPELQLGFLKFLKGTPVRETYREHDFVFDPAPPYQIIESRYLSRQQLHDITLLEHALELYWNGKRARNTLVYVCEQYSIFDFLLELGKAFAAKLDLHRHGLEDTYKLLHEFVRAHYPDDPYLPYFVAADYYLYPKSKPQPLFVEEVSRNTKAHILEALGLNPTAGRFVVFELPFDFAYFTANRRVLASRQILALKYDGSGEAAWFGMELKGEKNLSGNL